MSASTGQDDLRYVRNHLFDDIALGARASIVRRLTASDIQFFAALSEDLDPLALDAAFATSTQLHETVAHGALLGAFVSTVLGTRLPGPGTVYLGQNLKFLAPAHIGDTLTIGVEVVGRETATRQLRLSCRCVNQDGVVLLTGEAEVVAPTERIERLRSTLPDVQMTMGNGQGHLLDLVRSLGPVRMAAVHPCDALSLSSALDARAAGLVDLVLVAPRAKLMAIAGEAGLDISGIPIVDVAHSHAAAQRAVQMVADKEVEALMKGSLHTDELMAAVVAPDGGLRTGRRISHCFLMQTPAYPRPFILTDAAVNIAPSLEEKADIIRNAIDLAHAIGVARPRVAILAAVETVNPRMPATLDAAALCKMGDRGQIAGGVLDGPLAFDNAVSIAAARIKGIVSEVAGRADVMVVPDLESGNMLAKQLEYLGGATSAGIVLGARVPIVLTSRADSRESRIASCALAQLVAHRYRNSPP